MPESFANRVSWCEPGLSGAPSLTPCVRLDSPRVNRKIPTPVAITILIAIVGAFVPWEAPIGNGA